MNNVERARCIIQEFNKNYRPSPCCCIAQPNVVPGNMTLQIGTVTTGAPGTAAAASITGTAPNFFLNLTIPQGITGPTGPTGPEGEVGPTGPAIATAFGGARAATDQTVTLTGAGPYQIDLGTTLPAQNVTYGTNSVIVGEDGTYEIRYNADVSTADVTGSVTLDINDGTAAIPSTTQTDSIAAATPVTYNGTTFATLQAGDELTMEINSDQSANDLTVENASLTVVKIA